MSYRQVSPLVLGRCSQVTSKPETENAFLDADGFDERYRKPSVEDIELGNRMSGSRCAHPLGSSDLCDAHQTLDRVDIDRYRCDGLRNTVDGDLEKRRRTPMT